MSFASKTDDGRHAGKGKNMTLLRRIGLKLPVLRRAQMCDACGTSFACEISLGKGCWCGEVKLSEATREELRANYKKCLCRACLERIEGSSTSK